ncbi:MAG: hypothetical protein CMH83_00495 [Nocardioides sp.]|nr:hypothetical protein [Nocardioides sp.]
MRGSRVWVADIGDNNAVRSSVQVPRVPVARGDLDARGDVTTYTLVYADGARDAESLLVHPVTGRLVVMSKGLLGGYVYTAPERLDAGAENELEPVGTTIGIATDAAFLPDGRHLVVRDYSRAVVYTWPGLEQVARVDLPEQDQGEGIAVDGYRGVLVSSEGAGSPVWEVPWPADVRREVRPERGATTDPTASPEPAGSLLDDDPEAIGWDPLTSPWVWLVLGGTAAVVALSVATGRRRR